MLKGELIVEALAVIAGVITAWISAKQGTKAINRRRVRRRNREVK